MDQAQKTTRTRNKRAQAAIEYLLLLGVIVAIFVGGFTWWVGHSRDEANLYFSETLVNLYGRPALLRSGPGDTYP